MLFRRPSREQGQWLAVTQEGAVASAARVSATQGGRPRLEWFWRADADSMGNALKALQRQHPLRGAALVGVVPHERYRLLAAEAPDVPREEWRDAIRWSLREQVDFPVDDAVIDVLSLPAATQLRQSSQTLTVVMPREVHADMGLAADDHGFSWDALEVPETALRNICALGEEEGKAHALLAFGGQQALLVITFQGELIMMRNIEVTLSAIAAHEDSRGGALSRAALEVLRTLDTHERVHSQAPLAGLTVALPPGAGDYTLEMLADLIYLPVKALNLADHLDMSAVDEAVPELAHRAAVHELLSIGSALRGWLTQQGRQQLRLIEPGAQGAVSVPWGARMGLQLTGAALLLCMVAGGALAWMQHDAQSRLKVVKLKQADLQQQLALLTGPPVVKQLEQLRQRETTQRQMRDVLKGAGAQASTGYSDYLMALGRQAQAQLWITGMAIEGDGRNLELRGRTTDPANLPPYLARLHEEERFKGRRFAQVELQSVVDETETPQGLTDFILRGELPQGDGNSSQAREEAR